MPGRTTNWEIFSVRWLHVTPYTPSRRYKKYDEEVRIKKEENRVSEEAFLADVHGLKPGTEWERVARNCGFNSKVVHCKKDRARLRTVILSLKQETLLNRN